MEDGSIEGRVDVRWTVEAGMMRVDLVWAISVGAGGLKISTSVLGGFFIGVLVLCRVVPFSWVLVVFALDVRGARRTGLDTVLAVPVRFPTVSDARGFIFGVSVLDWLGLAGTIDGRARLFGPAKLVPRTVAAVATFIGPVAMGPVTRRCSRSSRRALSFAATASPGSANVELVRALDDLAGTKGALRSETGRVAEDAFGVAVARTATLEARLVAPDASFGAGAVGFCARTVGAFVVWLGFGTGLDFSAVL